MAQAEEGSQRNPQGKGTLVLLYHVVASLDRIGVHVFLWSMAVVYPPGVLGFLGASLPSPL